MNKERIDLEYNKRYCIDNEPITCFVMSLFVANEFNSPCIILHTNRCRYILSSVCLSVQLINFDIIGKTLIGIDIIDKTIEIITTDGSYYVELLNG